jgi:hypothetical protein
MDNLLNWSQRAKSLLEQYSQREDVFTEGMIKCQIADGLWVAFKGQVECEEVLFSNQWPQACQVLFLSFEKIMKKKEWSSAKTLSLRELEAFLRDRNSEPALPPESFAILENNWPKILQSIDQIGSTSQGHVSYQFSSQKVFATLSLPEKIQELKSFFSSEILLGFYRQGGRVEVLDIEDFTVYVALDCGSIPEAPLLDWMQMKLVETFRESALNIIPEAFPS